MVGRPCIGSESIRKTAFITERRLFKKHFDGFIPIHRERTQVSVGCPLITQLTTPIQESIVGRDFDLEVHLLTRSKLADTGSGTVQCPSGIRDGEVFFLVCADPGL